MSHKDLHLFVLSSNQKEMNQKTSNSLKLLESYPIEVTWVNDILDLLNINISNPYCLLMPAGDHITRSYLDGFLHIPKILNYAYQPYYSYIFSKRGRIFYRKNIDITPNTDEINTLLLYPHHSRHIIFPSIFLNEVIENNIPLENIFWKISQAIIENDTCIVTIPDSISMEYLNHTIHDKEEIYKDSFPSCASDIFTRESFLTNQNFSDLYKGD